VPVRRSRSAAYSLRMRADLPNLHDAVLESVSVDFQSGTAELRVGLVGGGVVHLACKPFRRLVIDRDQPWGPSDSIMGVTGGNERLDVEMQSGDTFSSTSRRWRSACRAMDLPASNCRLVPKAGAVLALPQKRKHWDTRRVATRMVHVELLDEDVEVWRPVEAEQVAEGLFRLPGSSPEDELWAFPPGSLVVCETRDIGFAAVELADHNTLCTRCGGSGIDPVTSRYATGKQPCERCAGTGEDPEQPPRPRP
jgi:hypothetical protein